MRVILADHHRQALWALKTTLCEEPGLEIVGEANHTADLVALAEKGGYDLVLVDRMLPGIPIEELIPVLKAFEPRPIVIVIGSRCEESGSMLSAGAEAFVCKADRPECLLETLHRYAG